MKTAVQIGTASVIRYSDGTMEIRDIEWSAEVEQHEIPPTAFPEVPIRSVDSSRT